MQTIIEPGNTYPKALGLMGEDNYADFILHLAANPQDGDIISKTGGFRKIRWAKEGTGKRGGVRIIYLPLDTEIVIALVYAKNESDSLSAAQKAELKDYAALLKGSDR